MERATLAGGCFWCLETVFERLRGVTAVVSGYSGGHLPDPTYEQVCGGDTGHAEAVQVAFDPAVLSYRDLLEVFFTLHDPTTPDRQGPDSGPQYRSAVFTHTADQERTVRDVIAQFTRDRVYADPIVTEVVPATTFYPAEAYHQLYFRRNPAQPYCRAIIAPKVAKLRQKFLTRLTDGT